MSRKSIIILWVAAVVLTPMIVHADSHRTETTPTAWWWYHDQTDADIADLLEDTGARLVDIEIQSTDPLRFSAAFVHNSGVYAEAWWWYFNATSANIADMLALNEARLIDIERYETAAGPRYAAIMVDNTGPDSKAWWWYVNATEEALTDIAADNNARLIDIESYEDGGTKYAAIMISNTGEDASAWWWFFNVPASTIVTSMERNGSRVLEYQLRDPVAGTFDAILVPNDGQESINWWWYYHATDTQLNALLSQNGARISDIDTYEVAGQRRYSVVMLNNSNALTTKMGGLLGYGADGSTGVYLQEVGGPVLASLQPVFVYEPASSIKVTHHLYAMRQVMIRADYLGATFTVAKGIEGLSCPDGGPPYVTQTLETTLAGMMQRSDNTDTEAIHLRYGRAAINAMSASVVGMTNTSINHTPGCPWPPLNEMTLQDAALLYEGVATGLLLTESAREDFYRLMQSETTFEPWWFTNQLESLIHDVAADLGMSERAADYWDNTRLAWKPGGDTLHDGAFHHYRAVSGWVSLPWSCGGSAVENREYVFGLFIHDASDSTYCDTRFFHHTIELFREQVAAGLQACVSAVEDPEIDADASTTGTGTAV